MENDLETQGKSIEEASPRFNAYIVLVPLVFLFGLTLGYMIWGRDGATAAAPQPAQVAAQPEAAAAVEPAAAPTQEFRRYPVPVDDDPALGKADAPITIIEFSDFECPYCQRWYTEVYKNLLETYPDTVRFVYRDFPLTSIHPNAQPAAEAANCAYEQGAFFEFHDKLFSMELGLNPDAYQQYASQLGLDVEKFSQCVEERRYQQEVEADLEYAANLGVNSTPTFFINGIPVVGAQPYEVFEYVIEKELAGELPK